MSLTEPPTSTLLAVIGECVAAMTMQLKRESGEWEIAPGEALKIWNRALDDAAFTLRASEYPDTEDKYNPNNKPVQPLSSAAPYNRSSIEAHWRNTSANTFRTVYNATPSIQTLPASAPAILNTDGALSFQDLLTSFQTAVLEELE